MSALAADWRVVPLNDLQSSAPRAITDGPFGSNLTSAHYTSEGARVVRLQNIGDGVFHDAAAFISMTHYAALRNHSVNGGDLLIASLGEELPRACLAPHWLGPAIVKADCIRVRLRGTVDSRYVMYALQAPATRRWAAEHLHGVGRPRLGLKVIREIPIPLPRQEIQRRIVEILDDHLSRLDAADRQLAVAANRASRLRGARLNQLLGVQAQRLTPLGNLLVAIEAGRSRGGSAPPAGPDNWGVVKVSAMTWGRFREDQNKIVPDAEVDPRHEIHTGDLLLSRANTSAYVGATVLVGDTRPRLLLSDKSLRLVPRSDVDPRWLAAVLAAPGTRRQLSALATGTKDSMRNISQPSLRSVLLPEVTAAEQSHLIAEDSAMTEAANRLGASLRAGQARSAALRRALLAAAFSGRLTGSARDDAVVEELAEA